MKRKYHPHLILICIATVAVIAACKQSFEPDIKSTSTNYLVVDGFVNCGNDSTTINLSRTVLLSQKQSIKNETGATLSVESSTGIFYSIKETKPGKYQAAPLNLPLTATYRLNIKTSNGKIYQSDFVEAKVTPPVEQVGYESAPEGITLNVSTQDATNNTHYYRWVFNETWKFHSEAISAFESTGIKIIPRVTPIHTCYRTESSPNILITSTLKLAQDVVNKRFLTSIPFSSDRISDKYSINVKQYALTREGYEFWDSQRKNTELLGGIFDAQPSELKGNIHCITNPLEPVVGFLSVCSESFKRIFINQQEVNWPLPLVTDCSKPDTIRPPNYSFNFYFSPGAPPQKIPVDAIYVFGNIVAYTAVDIPCADCRLRGTTQVPPFWQ